MTSKFQGIVNKLSKSNSQDILPDEFLNKDRLLSKAEIDLQTQFSIISKNSSFEGELNSNMNILIAGKFKGNITCKNTVISLEGSVVDGEIKAKDIILYGNFRGNIISSNLVKLFPSSCINAKIKGKTFIIEEGAVFDGEFDLL